jgi:glycosyltransferase involved in cell wall biosynthesis
VLGRFSAGLRGNVVSEGKPRVSIGMPVYNGERYLLETLDSLLAQTFKDFELIISDNGSTDRTEQICRSYAARDGRIRYYRGETNRGAAWNHNRVFALSSGEYFKWQAHDDLCHPKFLEECVAVLDGEPSAVLCYSQFVRIDEHGKPVEKKRWGWGPIGSSVVKGAARPHERFSSLIYRRDSCEEIYGLMRASVMRETRLIGNYTQSDDNFLAELALRGQFSEVPKPLFFNRLHTDKSTEVYRNRLSRMSWFDPSTAGITIPFYRQFREYLSLIHRAPLPWRERVHCYLHMGRWLWKFRRWLRADLDDAIFVRTVVPFLKQYAPWTRPIWHVYTSARGWWWKAQARRRQTRLASKCTLAAESRDVQQPC